MGALDGVRIVSLEQYGAGPFATMHLAALGAEVIKIEDPRTHGDVGRYVPPFSGGEDSLFFESFNRNKSSIALDMSTDSGRQVFEDLVRSADAVFSNLRGDVPAKLRITYDDLRHVNPAIVCCSLTGFGMDGPRSKQPGYDYVLQALAGWMSVTGEPDGPPQKSGLSLVDYSGGLVAGLALTAGVLAARRDGIGMDCDLSLYDTAIGMLTYVGTWAMNEDWQPQRMSHSAHPSLVPFQAFEAQDGWLVIGCAKEKFWLRLTEVIGRPDLAAEPRFATFADRAQHRDELIPLLEEVLATRSVAEWIALMEDAAVPCAPIKDIDAALADEHTIARGLVVETEHPRFGRMRSIASPVRVGPRLAPEQNRRGPLLGEDTDDVLASIGYDAARAGAARAGGAFGTPESRSA